MGRAERALEALVADFERQGDLDLDQVNRVVQRRELSAEEAAWVRDQLVELGALSAPESPTVPPPGEDAWSGPLQARPDFEGFVQRAKRHRLLRAEEEVILGRRVRAAMEVLDRGGPHNEPERQVLDAGMRAREEFVLANTRLVLAWARRPEFAGQGLEYEDLVQSGFTGLMRAVEKFDPERGYKFSTYAVWWIRQAMSRALADTGRLIRLPVHVVDDLKRIRRALQSLEWDLGRPPTHPEIAAAVRLPPDKVAFLLDVGREHISLDAEVAGAEGDVMRLADILLSTDPGPDEHAILVALQEQIHSVLDTLSEREAGVLALRYGLDEAGEERTLDQVGRIYGITRERVRQILALKVLPKLRHPSRSMVLWPYAAPEGLEDELPAWAEEALRAKEPVFR